MKHPTKYLVTAASVLFATLCFSPASQAIVVADRTTFQFDGTCTDCETAGGADPFLISAELVLQNYVSDTELNRDNFFSFSYSGSNLINGFSIDKATWDGAFLNNLIGTLSPDGGPADVSLGIVLTDDSDRTIYTCTALGDGFLGSNLCDATNKSVGFFSELTGEWRIGLFDELDEGEAGTWSPAAIPTPGTLALFALGLGGIGYKRHRSKKAI